MRRAALALPGSFDVLDILRVRRAAELDSRRELGLIVHDAAVVKTLVETFESDWAASKAKKRLARWKRPDASDEDVTRAIQVFTKELDPLTASVKRAVRQAVAKAGEDVLNDRDVTTKR